MKKSFLRFIVIVAVCAVVFNQHGMIQSQHLPLPPDAQKLVDQAIDNGVKFLKGTQNIKPSET